VPPVLLSGHHDQIAQWRRTDALLRTFAKRPDLLRQGKLSHEEMALLRAWHRDIESIIHGQAGSGPDASSGNG
jgi:tRNA (guanine37-N1)-methyltransferase